MNFPKNYISVTRKIFWELISRKLHITYSFVIQTITWKNVLGIIFLENLISVTWNNVFRVSFAIIFGWSVTLEGHNPPPGSPRKFASRRVLRGLCRGLFEGSAGLRGVLRGSAGVHGISDGSDPILLTLETVVMAKTSSSKVVLRIAAIWNRQRVGSVIASDLGI